MDWEHLLVLEYKLTPQQCLGSGANVTQHTLPQILTRRLNRPGTWLYSISINGINLHGFPTDWTKRSQGKPMANWAELCPTNCPNQLSAEAESQQALLDLCLLVGGMGISNNKTTRSERKRVSDQQIPCFVERTEWFWLHTWLGLHIPC